MRSLAVILLAMFVYLLPLPNARAGELDGKGLICKLIDKDNVFPQMAVPIYGFYFSKGMVERYWVSKRVTPVEPVKVQGRR